ncbi:MAG: hypothetical protein M1324_02270 [Patescibacteria group bacterium]|nr:hypothetical protein [Patescibacteria group bacterium]
MFSRFFNLANLSDLLGGGPPSMKEVEDIIQKDLLGLRDIALLLLAQGEARHVVFSEAVRRRTEKWDKRLFLMPPLYISSGDLRKGRCLGDCAYCAWGRGEHSVTRLEPNEVELEALKLIEMGYKEIEFVAATDSLFFNSSICAEYVAAARRGGAINIGLNFFPYKSPDDYRALAESGVTFSIVWQETYDREVYRNIHPLGAAKFNYEYRLDAHDRALLGGVKSVGVAFLGGLSDWRFEALATICHARYLQSEYGANIIFGMPRWKEAPGIDFVPTQYTDEDYLLVGALYSLSIPESLPWFSTREPFDLSAKASEGGGCLFTLDCSTKVGGYLSPKGEEQFPVYSYDFRTGTSRLRELGFKPEVHLPW